MMMGGGFGVGGAGGLEGSNKHVYSAVVAMAAEEQTMNCPFSVIMVPVLCRSQVQYYDN